MAGANQSGSDGLADRECLAWPDGCDRAVQWQTDGAKRCLQHQRLYERTSRRSRLVSLTVAALIVVVGAVAVGDQASELRLGVLGHIEIDRV